MSLRLIRTRLEYVHPWPNHAGFFLARGRGLFAERGLDVDLISDGWDRGDAAALLARGEYDIGVLRLGQLLESRRTDVPFVGVATLNQSQLGGLITIPATGIRRFRDLEDRVVAIPPVDRLHTELAEAIAADGGDPARVTIRNPGVWEPDVRAVEQGRFDAVVNVKAWEPFQGNTDPENVVVIEFDSVGVAPHHSYFVSVRQEMLEREPELVRGYLDAVDAGYQRALAHEDEAVEAFAVPLCHISPDVVRASLRAIRGTWCDEAGRWGRIQPELVEGYTRWMSERGFFDSLLDLTHGATTNAFLPEAESPAVVDAP